MKKTIKFLAMILSLSAVTIFTACDGGDDDKKIDDLINNGPDLADGYYIVGTAISADTTAANSLVQGRVNAPDFDTQDRPGFFEAYVYMSSGSFSFIKVEGDDVTELGGAFADSVGTDGDDEQAYIVGTLDADGSATSPYNSLVHVSVDETTGQYVILPITYWEIIGTATGSWSEGQELAQKSGSADEVVFEGTGITLRPGEMKIRANSTWGMYMELPDANCDNATTACYSINTNFGGTVENLVTGKGGSNGNIQFTGEGVYTVTVTYAPAAGLSSISLTLTRTGDAEEITYDPTEYPWQVRGSSVLPDDWSDGPKLTPNHDGTTYRWYGMILVNEGQFKVTDGGNNWIGLSGVTDNTGGVFTEAGDGNFIVSAEAAGFYYIVVTTSDDGATYNISVDKGSMGLIGSATAAVTGGDGWAADADMTESGATFTITIDLAVGDIKFRANNAWEYNLGGDLAGLSHNGDNIAIAAAGNYTIVLTTADTGGTYSATVTQN